MATETLAEGLYTDDRFFLSDFQRYAASEGATITFKCGEELYHVDANQLTLSYMAADSAPVDPLLAFKDVDGFPYVSRGDLKEMPGGIAGGETPVFRVERFKGGVGQLQLFSWKGMVAEVSRIVGRDASAPPDTTLRGLLEYRGGVPPEFMEVAARSQEEGETFGQALIRLDFAQPRDLLFAALGGSRLFNPTCHMANAVGRALLDAKAIKKDDLDWAIEQQVASGKSLAAILHGNGACSGEKMSAALEALEGETIFLPPTDKMGELLVKRGKLSRTALMSALFKLQGGKTPLAKYLVDEELATAKEVADAEAWHDLKLRLRTAGKVRVGQLLLESGAITKAILRRALQIQIERPDPLGEILMSEGLCSPEAVIEALLEQETRLNELVAGAIATGDRKAIEELPLFDLPLATLKGQKARKKRPPKEEEEAEEAPKKGTGKGGAKGAKGKGTGKLDPAKGKGTGKLDPGRSKGTAKLSGAARGKGKGKGRKGTGKLAAKEAPKLPLKQIGLGAAAVAVFGALAFGAVTVVNSLSKPGAPLAPKVAAATPAPTPTPATAFSAGAALQDQLFSTESA
ncbi:MAG: hypothetical protein FJZ01_26665, partial [Candidatus Sericytochromatia bacterium]|nr:hypothetical protein [Candidatus Tanganyikabacteria bacterium]